MFLVFNSFLVFQLKLVEFQYLSQLESKIYEIASKKFHSLLRAFQWYQEHSEGCCGLGDFNMVDKETKQTTFFNR
jgi:hypothetical protein